MAKASAAPPPEQRAWKELRAQLFRYAGILKPLLARRPPDLDGMSLSESAGARPGRRWRCERLGKEDMRDFLRVLLMNVADVLDEQLADDRLKGLLAFDATLGSHLGPRSPTSLLGLYYRLTGEIGGAPGAQIVPEGGMGAVVGCDRRCRGKRPALPSAPEPRSTESVVEKGRAVGVVLENGEEIRARTVVSAINPPTTFLDLVGPRELDTGFVRKVKKHPHERRCGQAASGARPAAANFSASSADGASRTAGHRALARPCRTRLQPVEIRRVLARAGHGDHAAQPRRPVAGA